MLTPAGGGGWGKHELLAAASLTWGCILGKSEEAPSRAQFRLRLGLGLRWERQPGNRDPGHTGTLEQCRPLPPSARLLIGAHGRLWGRLCGHHVLEGSDSFLREKPATNQKNHPKSKHKLVLSVHQLEG